MVDRSLQNDFHFSSDYNANPFSISHPTQTPVLKSLALQPFENASNFDDVSQKTTSISPKSLKDFISKKRDIFLVEYGLSVKRDDLICLENSAREREVELVRAERLLEEDATNFDEFLRDTNLITQRTISSAENYVEERFEKSNCCQKLKTEIILHKTEISKNDELLSLMQNYEIFLKTLVSSSRDSKSNSEPADNISDLHQQISPISTILNRHPCDSVVSPVDLLEILTALEENNLSLIINSQEIEEALEDLIHSSKLNKDKLLNHVNSLNIQINLLQSNIADVQSRANDLEIKARMFSYGEFKEEDQDCLHNIDKTVQKVYITCIGHNEANIGTLQMLSSIENRVEELFELLEGLSSEKVKNAELARGKERRILFREKKIEEEKFHQDDRMKRSLARANANPRKITGRKLLFRSNPPKEKHLKALGGQRKDRDEEDNLYYFS